MKIYIQSDIITRNWVRLDNSHLPTTVERIITVSVDDEGAKALFNMVGRINKEDIPNGR